MNKKKEKQTLSIRIPPVLNKKLDKHVATMGLSKNAFILSLINQAITIAEDRKIKNYNPIKS